jgi:ubiquinone/menaquinone biosynthesis C-methylase UbiE
MTNPAQKRFLEDYRAYNKSLRIPHPYFQQIQYVKINSMIIDCVLAKKHDRILDVGSGSGHLINGLSAQSAGCVALDIEAERLSHTCKKNLGITCVLANVELGLPFKNDSYDCVIASELLEHLNQPKRFYKEVARILKKEGILVLTTPNCDNLSYKIIRRLPRSWAISLAEKSGADIKLHPQLSYNGALDSNNPHLHKVEGYSLKELITMGEEQGLKAVFCRTFGLAIPDSAYSHMPKTMTRVIVNKVEDHIPFALRHFIVYENK